jgi:hypothetical protein
MATSTKGDRSEQGASMAISEGDGAEEHERWTGERRSGERTGCGR